MNTSQAHAMQLDEMRELSTLMRHWILRCTHAAGSGHPTSSLSAIELMSGLFFGGHFRFEIDQPEHPNNDRLIFSKGHASPLYYALWTAANAVSEEELMRYREFDSRLEGHPTSRFRFTEAATGSLGQGLSVGVGMALHGHVEQLPYRVYVLLGDSEMTEGSQWEAIQLAAHYRLDNLVGVLDVNRLGQRGATMLGRNLSEYRRRVEAFGWRAEVLEDGHDLEAILAAYQKASESTGQPVMLIAGTVKGKGVSFLEDAEGWHGKALEDEQLQQALNELGSVDESLRGELLKPQASHAHPSGASSKRDAASSTKLSYRLGEEVATRQAYGNALKRLGEKFPQLVALDGEVSNSTGAATFQEEYPDRFFEMYVAEQNMVGVATGLALRGKAPFVSTFAAFMTRAFDQIRMSIYSEANVKFVGSHCGVSIGQDGPSQMGLEDIAMFRTIRDSMVLYPCDAVSTERLVEALLEHEGVGYLRTTRGATPVIYDNDETFTIGGSHTLRRSDRDEATIVAAGVTLHEALEAHKQLEQESVLVRVIDLYSVKPLDAATLRQAATETGFLLTVEDHFPEGGLGEAVRSSLADTPIPIHSLAVRKRPRSGSPERLREQQGIDARSIAARVKRAIESRKAVR